MARKTKGRAPSKTSPEAAATVDQGSTPPETPAAPVPAPSHTTALVADALRRNHAEGGPGYARAELIAALAGCALFSIELDGLAATLALLADAAIVLERGFKDAGPAPGARVH